MTNTTYINMANADGQMHPAPESVDGNLIEDPVLADYVHAYREPGILVEPYDVTYGEENQTE
jgi:hypothetical protein